MKVEKIPLCFDMTDTKRGYVIQNLQESRAFRGHCIKDIVIQSITMSIVAIMLTQKRWNGSWLYQEKLN
jgi:hypothetical protein